jgi:hypothetical protein
MNELVAPDRGLLVPYSGTGAMALATTYYFDQKGFETSVEQALSLSDARLHDISSRARDWFQQNQRTFATRVGAALQAALG